MNNSDKILCRIASIEKKTGHILYCRHFAVNPPPGLVDAKEFMRNQLKLANGEPFIVIHDLSGIYVNWTTEAKEFSVNYEDYNKQCLMYVSVITSLPIRLVYNIYISFFRPKIKTKFFSNLEDAEKYVLKLEKKLFKSAR